MVFKLHFFTNKSQWFTLYNLPFLFTIKKYAAENSRLNNLKVLALFVEQPRKQWSVWIDQNFNMAKRIF